MNTIFKYITIIVLGLFAHNSFAQHNGEIIIPITVDEIKIDSVKQDILAILNGGIDSSLVELEIKKAKKNKFKRNGYEVKVSFAYYDNKGYDKRKFTAKERSIDKAKLLYWSYMHHGKEAMYITDTVLTYINDNYLSKLPYEGCEYSAKLFIPEYRYPRFDYLYVSAESHGKKVELVFIYDMPNMKMFKCIVKETGMADLN